MGIALYAYPYRILQITMHNQFVTTDFFDKIVNSPQEGRVHIVGEGVEWRLDIVDGHLLFAAHSLQYLTALETALLDLGYKAALPAYWRLAQLSPYKCKINDPGLEVLGWTSKVVMALVKRKTLNLAQAKKTLARLSEDAVESLLGLEAATVTWSPLPTGSRPTSHGLELSSLLHRLSDRLQGWSAVSDRIASPHQRPYCEAPEHIHKPVPQGMLPRPMLDLLARLMQGASIRQLARIVHQDEIKLAQLLYPYIKHRVIKLWPPVPPLDQLPWLPTRPLRATPPPSLTAPLTTLASLTSNSHSSAVAPLITFAPLTNNGHSAIPTPILVPPKSNGHSAIVTPTIISPTSNGHSATSTPTLIPPTSNGHSAIVTPILAPPTSNGHSSAAPLTTLPPLTSNGHSSTAPNSLVSCPATFAKRRYLIICIDDNLSVQEKIQSYLVPERFELKTVVDPMASIAKICTLKPDLILLDISMPRINGHSLCRILRRSILFKEIPIIMISSHVSALNKAKARSVGATDYLEKPFSQTKLMTMLETYLGKLE